MYGCACELTYVCVHHWYSGGAGAGASGDALQNCTVDAESGMAKLNTVSGLWLQGLHCPVIQPVQW
jgi:hypothetical protein